MSGPDMLRYGEKDNSKIVYLLIFLLSILCIWYSYSMNLYEKIIQNGVSPSSNFIPTILIAVFRTLCAYLAFHSVLFWMILDRKGGFMYAYSHEKKEVLPLRIYGLTRMVPFSSWNAIVFSFTFISLSIISWMSILEINIPNLLHAIATILFSISLGMTTLTATIVTYVIIPGAVKTRDDYHYLFEKHQQVMHNWVLILIIADLIITSPSMLPEFAVFPISMAITYAIFAYIYANWGGGFYVYQFIDPRLKYAAIIMTLLGIMIGAFYILTVLISYILELNYLIGSLIFISWTYSIILFKDPKRRMLKL